MLEEGVFPRGILPVVLVGYQLGKIYLSYSSFFRINNEDKVARFSISEPIPNVLPGGLIFSAWSIEGDHILVAERDY